MTFTYTEDLSVPIDFVRFHSGDALESESVVSDELITSLIAVEGDQYLATIAVLRYMRRRLIRPDIKADWVSVTGHAAAVKALDELIKEKQGEFGVSTFSATVTHVRRPSSGQKTTVDYGDDTE